MDSIHNIYAAFLIPLATLLIILLATRNKHFPKFIRIILSLTPCFIIILGLLSYIIFHFVGGGLNEVILYHLTAGFGEIDNPQEFYPLILFAISVILISLLSTFFTYRIILNTNNKRYSSIFLLAIIPLFYFHPMSIDLHTAINNYLNKPTEEDLAYFQSLNYDPTVDQLTLSDSTEKKDIIFLFLEGIEHSFYRNNELFPDLMPNLKRIAEENIEFTAIRQLDATSNTITGTSASLCGVPLINRKTGHEKNKKETFLPNATCFGDILQLNGYRNTFITGYNKNFTHKGAFYRGHGFAPDDLYGNDEIVKLMPYPVKEESWLGGIFDTDLFAFIFHKYDELSQDKRPFSIVINTLDTHAQDGYLDVDRCGDYKFPLYDGINMPNVLHCTDRVLGDFYDKLKNHPNAKNTLLVIASDHQMPGSDILPILFDDNDRGNTFIIVDFENQSTKTISREGLQFDMTTTILNYAGWDIEGIHFGRNLFDLKSISMINEFNSTNEVDKIFSSWGRLFSYFWLPPKTDSIHHVKDKQ